MTPTSSRDPRLDPDGRVDALRQQLRALGYLDAGVDRFVLRPAHEARRPVAIAALAALRIGMLAAALLGPAAAVGIGTRLPGLITGLQDAVVVALYLAGLFGIAAAATAFVAAMVVSRLPVAAVRARAVSRAAGTIVGAASLVYLTLWWRIASDGGIGPSPLWALFALAMAVAISLLLGHATAIASFAVLVATSGRATSEMERPGTARRLTAAAAAVAFAGGAILLLVAAPGPPEADDTAALSVISPGTRVRLLAIDGFDPAIMQRLKDDGRLPSFARLFSGGAVQLTGDTIDDPARRWATIATGQPPDVHGVTGLETRRVAGLQGSVASGDERGVLAALRDATDLVRLTRPSTASGADLRVKTLWEIAADAGLRAAVVNWWATWPAIAAGPNAPTVISDRAVLRLERGGELNGEIAPQGVYDRLKDEWPAITREAATLLTTLLPVTTDADSAAALRRAAEVDALQLALASRLDVERLDLLAIYLPGLDIAQHALLRSRETAAPSAIAARLDAVRSYYEYLDRLLQDTIVPAPNELLVVLTQPGRLTPGASGLLAAAGPGALQGVVAKGRPVDVTPTVLHALGVPISRELPGAPILGLFTPEYVRRYSVRQVESYGRRSAPRALIDGQPLDAEMIERLRSLGYVR